MSPEQLRTLVAVVAEGTFDRAATALHITQSAVSQRIKALETEVGRPVVSRTIPVAATPVGTVLLRHAKAIELLESELEIGIEHTAVGSNLEIAVNAESLSLWFAEALALAATKTDKAFTVFRDDEGHTAELMKSSGTIVAAVSADAQPAQGCRAIPLGRLSYSAVASPAFAQQWSLNQNSNLAQAPMVQFDSKDTLQDLFLRERGLVHHGQRHLVPSSGGFAQAITAGLGWGLMPHEQVGQLPSESFMMLAETAFERALYWHVWHIESTALKALTDSVIAVAARHLGTSTAVR